MLRLFAFLIGFGIGIGGAYVGTAFAEPKTSEQQIRDYESKKQKLNQDTKDKTQAEKDLAALEKQLAKLEAERDGFNDGRSEIFRNLNAAKESLDAVRRMSTLSTADTVESFTQKKENIAAEEKKVKELQAKLDEFQKHESEVRKSIKEYEEKIDDQEDKVSDLKKSVIRNTSLGYQEKSIAGLKTDLLLTDLNVKKAELGNDKAKLEALIKDYDQMLNIDKSYIGNYVLRKIWNQNKIQEAKEDKKIAQAKAEITKDICRIAAGCSDNAVKPVSKAVGNLSKELDEIQIKLDKMEKQNNVSPATDSPTVPH